MREFKRLEKLEYQKQWRAKKKSERQAHDAEVLAKKRACAEKARVALKEIRAGKRVSQAALRRAERRLNTRLEAVKKAAAKAATKVLTERENLEPGKPTFAEKCATPILDFAAGCPARWRMTDGHTTIDLGSVRKHIAVTIDDNLVVDLHTR